MAAFWAVTPCSLIDFCQLFRGSYYLNDQGENPKGSHLFTHSHENLKSYMLSEILPVTQIASEDLTLPSTKVGTC